MKKIKYLFIIVLSFLFILPNVKAEEQIDLYLFHSNTCSHCSFDKQKT